MSWEATCWVMDKSAHKGCDLFTLLLIANDMNKDGRGTTSTVLQLSHQLRINLRTVIRILRRLERSGELICEFRGTGHLLSDYCIPGVIRDGYSIGSRGGKLPPQGRRIAIPGVAERHPRGGKTPPTTLSTGGNLTLQSKSKIPPPPPVAASAAATSSNDSRKAPQELREWLRSSCMHLDSLGADRLWAACRARVPECTPLTVEWTCQHKLERSRGARNLAGLIIATVPDLLLEEVQAAKVVLGGKNNA